MSKEVIDVLNDFYVALRISSDDEGAIPVTARELPALARLAEAVARIQLSEKITMEHAQITMDLVMGSLEDVGIDPETGEFDAYIKETGQPKSQHKRYQQVRETVEVLGDGQPVSRETALAFLKDEHNIDRSQAMTILKRLLKKGDLYQVDDEKIALA
jgi:replicative DNA helicase Mcm